MPKGYLIFTASDFPNKKWKCLYISNKPQLIFPPVIQDKKHVQSLSQVFSLLELNDNMDNLKYQDRSSNCVFNGGVYLADLS